MIPYSKIHTNKTSNRPGELLVTNIATTDPFRSRADNDYIAKKKKEMKEIYEEIARITMGFSFDDFL